MYHHQSRMVLQREKSEPFSRSLWSAPDSHCTRSQTPARLSLLTHTRHNVHPPRPFRPSRARAVHTHIRRAGLLLVHAVPRLLVCAGCFPLPEGRRHLLHRPDAVRLSVLARVLREEPNVLTDAQESSGGVQADSDPTQGNGPRGAVGDAAEDACLLLAKVHLSRITSRTRKQDGRTRLLRLL